jgi:acetoin utilization protein AcuB
MTNVADLMSYPVVTVTPRTTVAEALRIAESNRIRHLVVQDGDQLRGVLCTCDLESAIPDEAVLYWMTRSVKTTHPEVAAAQAAAEMTCASIGCLPVVEAGRLVGMISRSDLPKSSIEARRCTCCGSDRHVREAGRAKIELCHECRDTARPGSPDELGVGD